MTGVEQRERATSSEIVVCGCARTNAMNFIDSPDAVCERRMGGVSLLCRAVALGAIADKIMFRFPYSETLYLWSASGRTYHRASSSASPSDDAPPSSEPAATLAP